MRILFAGTPDFAAEALSALVKAGHEVPAVITMPDRPKGRKKQPAAPPVKETAVKLEIPVYQPENLKSDEAYEFIRQVDPELMVVTACGHIIPERILNLPKYGCINEHASILPAYRGAAPIQWAILDGCPVTGVTIMQMNKGLDTGDILSVKEVPITAEETGGSLFEKLSKVGAQLLLDTIEDIEKGAAVRKPQPKESTTAYARMIKKTDGLIDWNKSAKELERLVRGMDPWPGAYTFLKGKLLRIWKAEVCEDAGTGEGNTFCGSVSEEAGPVGKNTGKPGEVLCCGKGGALIRTGSGVLRLKELQMEGKKRMDCDAFLRGCRLEPGTVLGSE